MPEYHYDQLGTVAELYPLHKAVLTFQLNGRGPEQRALLWGRRFVCPNGLPLAEDESIDGVLCINDQVLFDCHIYDNENNQDRCGWYVARAESARRPEQLSSVVSNAMGTVVEVGPRRAFVEFRQPGRVELQRAVFVAARFFDHGGRLPAGTSLRSCVYEDQKLHLDAQHRPGQLQGASWYAWLAWRGQRPEVELDREPPAEVLAGEEEPPTQRPTATLADNLLPALSSAESRAQAQRRHQVGPPRRPPPPPPTPSQDRRVCLSLSVSLQDKWGYVCVSPPPLPRFPPPPPGQVGVRVVAAGCRVRSAALAGGAATVPERALPPQRRTPLRPQPEKLRPQNRLQKGRPSPL
ncbi:uncharacterized protein LOC122364754 isoform X1 [Amphibalanus amphitrite]|uniref:uncharacterized protein LOC122364754 isoform X1 n=1 Tax=Amphibalanus amphitrite TaxID=1232801 RepID=UPI001C921AF5|nr:uncharacterized protein LOC122364754 isoform X1 [Amphibalanus amphitrite]